MATSKTVEIYALVDPRTNLVRYIGKANNSVERFKSHMRDIKRRKTPLYSWLGKLVGLGLKPRMEVLEKCSVADWPAKETAWISQYSGRLDAKLLNVAPGGDEPFCPMAVRIANGKASGPRQKGNLIFWVLCQLGKQAKWIAGEGDHELAARLHSRQDSIRALTPAQRETFTAHWLAAGWACPPGYRHG